MKTKTVFWMSTWAMAALGAWMPLAGAQEPPAPPKDPAATKPGPKTVLVDAQGKGGLELVQADRVVGMELYDLTGARVGTIEDVILMPSGKTGFVVVQATVGGGSNLYPIPWSVVRFEGDSATDPVTGVPGKTGRLVITFDKSRLETAPSFTMNQWPLDDDMTVFNKAEAFYRTGKMPDPGRTDPTKPGDTVQPDRPGTATTSTLRLSRLRNVAVTDASGKPLGTIGTVIVDPGGGRLNYATMTLSEGPGSGRVIAIPWEAFRVSRENAMNRYVLNFPAEKLATAPQFQSTESSWKEMSDPQWVGRMYTFYQIRPYWSTMPEKTPGGEKPPPPGN